MRSDLVVDLPITVDRRDPRPLPAQLAQQIRELIARRVLDPGDHLPSGRSLAADLHLSRGTVVAAYDELTAEGYLVAAHGSGTSVNPDLARIHPRTAAPAPTPSRPSPLPDPLIELTPGAPDTSDLADPAWRAAWRTAASSPAPRLEDPLGSPALREEICEHLRQMRSLVADPSRIVVTAGAREGLALLLRSTAAIRTIGVESPGYPSLRRVPPTCGVRTVDLPTDDHGLVSALLPDAHLDAVLVTPGHQYPHGGSLSADRRVDLAAWAATHGAWIVEDDFDSELRHVGQPLPALAALEPSRTVLLGTFSSVLTPALACGYLVVPEPLVEPTRDHRRATGHPVAAIVQTALAHYLATGTLRRRTQRLRRVYRRRRDLVMDTLGGIEGAELRPIEGGLHAVLVCRAPEDAIVAGCARRGIGVTALSRYWGGGGAEHGIVLGFGRLDDATLAHALARVADAVRSLSPQDRTVPWRDPAAASGEDTTAG